MQQERTQERNLNLEVFFLDGKHFNYLFKHTRW